MRPHEPTIPHYRLRVAVVVLCLGLSAVCFGWAWALHSAGQERLTVAPAEEASRGVMGTALSAAPSNAQESPASEVQHQAPEPTASPGAGDGSRSQVGRTRSGDNADTTLLQIRRLLPPAGRRPARGEEWFGIRARICMDRRAARSGRLPWSSWAAVDDSRRRYQGRDVAFDDYPAQQLPTSRIRPGDCHTGWVLIAVPKGTSQRMQEVVFRPESPDPARWVL